MIDKTNILDVPEKEPSYKVIKTISSSPDSELLLVKLSREHIARKVGKTSYVDTKYVLLGMSSVEKDDEYGKFHYEETVIIASDEDGKMPENAAFLYLSTRRMTLQEAMFLIGEV